MSKAGRMARMARVRALQKQMALAQEGRALAELNQVREMAERIGRLRQVYTPAAAEAGGFALKAMAHQYERLGKALAATSDRKLRAGAAVDEARAVTLDAHRAKRAAEELHDRAEAAEACEAERRRERTAIYRRRAR